MIPDVPCLIALFKSALYAPEGCPGDTCCSKISCVTSSPPGKNFSFVLENISSPFT